ncbi:MAG: DNA mismatch repair protein MutS [Candidatus Heimdallarchaeaceae archaeon]
MKRVDNRKKKDNLTPMQRQWIEIKNKYPDYIIFWRLGDFYETFREDAKIASKALNITLTSRKTADSEWELAGVPHHAVDSYLARMVDQGFKIAVVEQLEDPSKAKKIVRRGVVRLVSKGTVTAPESLGKANNYLVSISKENDIYGLSAIDISTGEFLASNFLLLSKLDVELARLAPTEILVEKEFWDNLDLQFNTSNCVLTYKPDYYFDIEQGKQDLLHFFGVLSLDGFGLDENSPAIGAAGAIIRYLKETQFRSDFPNVTKISPIKSEDFMTLDSTTIKSLELIYNIRDGSDFGTLRQTLDNTKTSAGSRLLTHWILRPSLNITTIQQRLDAVEELFEDILKREDIRELLSEMSDIERINSRICLGRARPRELLALRNSIEIIPKIKSLLSDFDSPLLKQIQSQLDPLHKLVEVIAKGIADDAAPTISDGGVIRQGYNQELDELREIKKGGKSYLAALEAREKKRTGIKTLKVKFNKVFGYFIEVSKTYSDQVPADYERKQTLVNAERYITPELKEYEEKILTAEEKILLLEEELYNEILSHLTQFSEQIQRNAQYCAMLDVLATFAQNAVYNNYIKPEITEENVYDIVKGRHPVVEQLLKSTSFIPNDCTMEEEKNRILIITGPNMAGKSTYLRQVALIILMAHIGSFVPAEKAKIGLTDRIFTRIGAHDVLVENRSTFMVEMIESANILNNATEKSLVILDEIGRGTSTFDGVSLAWAITEYLHNNIGRRGPRTLLATHYHELIELEEILPRIKNYHVAVKNVNGNIHFLYKVKEGGIDESYGVHVASLAGIPSRVIERANEILTELHHQMNQDKKRPRPSQKISTPSRIRGKHTQLTLLGNTALHTTTTAEVRPEKKISSKSDDRTTRMLKELAEINVDKITPIEAINILDQLNRKSKKLLKEK